jgi:hypothetical protein
MRDASASGDEMHFNIRMIIPRGDPPWPACASLHDLDDRPSYHGGIAYDPVAGLPERQLRVQGVVPAPEFADAG